MWHKTDWAKVKEDPKSIAFPRENWILDFDAEKFAEDNFADAVKAGGASSGGRVVIGN